MKQRTVFAIAAALLALGSVAHGASRSAGKWQTTVDAVTVVIFSDWSGDFPLRIALRIDDPTQDIAAKPPYCPPPLVWNKATGRFIESHGDFYVSCSRH